MSYNPAFIADETPPGVLSSSISRQDSSNSSDGVKLTSFKPLPVGNVSLEVAPDGDNAHGRHQATGARTKSPEQQTTRNFVQKQGKTGSGARKTGSANKLAGEQATKKRLHHYQQQQHSPVKPQVSATNGISNINNGTSSNNNNNNNNNNFCLSASSSLSLIDNPTLSSFSPSASSYTSSSTTTTTTSSSSIVSTSGLCAAVECRDMCYEVGRLKSAKKILYQVNVTVPEGSIYGLLGPSGCGKTTMLRCVVGRIKPSSGYVRVFGYRPNESGSQIPGPAIGYMPQEISVYEDFTINETLIYFGKINKMKQDLIDARIEFLLNFLDLPNKNRLIASLSGGQKRRVSLAAALVHSPPLLILDEPTVGVDPLLRQSIWRHLVTLAQTEKITVIITTHYIEEARQANVVGLMRHGKMLAEDSPDNLMASHAMDNLENVFLKLCISDSSRRAAQLASLGMKLDSGGVESPATSPELALRLTSGGTETRFGASRTSGLSKSPVLLDANGSPIAAQLATNEGRVMAKKKRQFPSILTLGAGQKSESTTLPAEVTTNKLTSVAVIASGHRDATTTGDSSSAHSTAEPTSDMSATSGGERTLERDNVHQDDDDDDDDDDENGAAASTEFVINKNNLRSMVPGTKYAPKKVSAVAWFKSLLAVIWKNYIRLKRNPPVLIFEFILPAVQVILFCLCIGGDPFDVPLAVVNDEVIPQASRFFLEAIDKNAIRQVPFSNLSDAIESVKRGETWGAIHIPDRYTHYLQERLTHPGELTNETLANGTINIYPDLTNLHLALAMENTFREAFIKFARDTLNMFGYDPEAAELPIRVEEPVYGTLKRNGYLEFMAPGVVISITYVMATGLTALAFILEKRDGLLERSLVSGVTTSQILLAHASVQVLVMVMQISLVLAFTFFVFEIPSNGPFFWVVLLILLQGCTGMGFGLLVSAVCEEENTAVMMLVGTFYTNLILAGIIWPLEAMPRWLRWFSYAQPQTLPTETLRNILSRGWGIGETGVYLGFVVTLAWLIVFLLAAGLFMRYTK